MCWNGVNVMQPSTDDNQIGGGIDIQISSDESVLYYIPNSNNENFGSISTFNLKTQIFSKQGVCSLGTTYSRMLLISQDELALLSGWQLVVCKISTGTFVPIVNDFSNVRFTMNGFAYLAGDPAFPYDNRGPQYGPSYLQISSEGLGFFSNMALSPDRSTIYISALITPVTLPVPLARVATGTVNPEPVPPIDAAGAVKTVVVSLKPTPLEVSVTVVTAPPATTIVAVG